MSRDPLNRTTAPVIVRFFDLCFKQGVLDACELGDDYGAKEFVEKHKEAWDFGVLGEPDDFDWEMWRFTLYRWGRRAQGFKMFSDSYIYAVVKKDHLWYLLPYCMRFYLMGIEEWLEYPNPTGIQVFKSESRVHWKPVQRNARKMTVNDFIFYMQQFAYEFRRVPMEKREMSAVSMDGFCEAIFALTRKYKIRRTIRAHG